jgi:hypothetical protein
MLRRSKINSVSKKRMILNKERRQFTSDILRIRLMCEARIRGCTMTPSDCHEIMPRSAGGSILDPENVLALCRSCHHFITVNPAWSYEMGFLVHSWSGPADLVAAKRARNQFVYGNTTPQDEEDFDIAVEWDETIDWPEDDD